MNDYNAIYTKLRKYLTDEEIADAMLIPASLTAEEAEKARAEFVEMRMKMLEERSDEEILLGKLLSLKYTMKDYLENSADKYEQPLIHFLKAYVELSNKTGKDIANDIAIHPSRFSRILNGKEKINKRIVFRLERHSGDIIPAVYWWKLFQKEEELELLQAHGERITEYAKVENVLIPVNEQAG